MIPSTFDYVAPTTIDEAVAALAAAGEDAKIIAGGQSLMPVLRLRLAAPTTLVDLGRVPDLRGVREDGGDLVIGAMTTHHDVIHDPLVREHARLLAEATSTVADPQIRHRGTLGGALAHADPAGDLGAPVLALEATLVAAGPSGRRSIPVAEFFDDYFTTTLQPEEILVEVRIPKLTGWAARYEKFNRVAHAWSIVAVAATVQTDGGTIRQARVALTNMAAVPVRAHAVEQALVGQPATADTVRAAAEQATEGTSPMSDGNADADYRRQLARVLTRRAVATAADVA
ncbi:carbon monoxide dehydrogenase medium chain [Rhodococcus aetherivorans]|uniref:Carbon monoxide dehydrogenase medium chain n=1 Tax=Rhodococcus aetherivorans TaxID=191292 RepID=A0ABQ0YH67_9NOCA|nr:MULTISPECIES: xanthine dehydrogenase family protein subunit M [Rhodococcus]ETT28861.1 Carbon-monoxide dehydrogenase (acceptor) [Rhodococcus rhodochrous ATCC 21198]NCL76014.1 Carbon monoxide dehydrogenase medium chain [Rhodococcus sp. YH1]MDV6293043.1 xanthine dehydrogenase family protein subunit M [Rhodococcus aetherivorans]NGP25385.1 xanthine dehydrogenase family protein subunit M [Rhodococcus aetherivorans]PND50772.1 xanthine dehydrogenase family protein subunit M [Rhodococcus sp. ENV425]